MCGRGRYSTLASSRVRELTNRRQNRIQALRQQAQEGSQPPPNNASEAQQPNASLQVDSSTTALELGVAADGDGAEFPHIQNLGPGMPCPIITITSEGQLNAESMIWGLIPHYFPSHEKGNHFQLFNKRIEGLSPGGGETAGKYFQTLITAKRGVVVFDGFYEWKMIAGKKQPYYIRCREEGEPLMMPVIYEDSSYISFRDLQPVQQRTFSILTSSPCPAFEALHNRQPVFLRSREDIITWLDPKMTATALEQLTESMRTAVQHPDYPFNRLLHFYPVTKRITEMKYQEEDCIKEVSLGADMTTFFRKQPQVQQEQARPAEPASSLATTSATKSTADAKNITTPAAPGRGSKRSIDEVDLTLEDEDDKRFGGCTQLLPLPNNNNSSGDGGSPHGGHLSKQAALDALLQRERRLASPLGRFFSSTDNDNNTPTTPTKRKSSSVITTPSKKRVSSSPQKKTKAALTKVGIARGQGDIAQFFVPAPAAPHPSASTSR